MDAYFIGVCPYAWRGLLHNGMSVGKALACSRFYPWEGIMGYRNANSILPRGLLRAVQEHIDGAYIYIPRRDGEKRNWGANTGIRGALRTRNREIAAKRRAGASAASLAGEYFLSVKTIQKIVRTTR